MPRSKARRIKLLFKKRKGLIRDINELATFKEPVMFLERRSGNVEFYEEATKGEFEFTHSDGKARKIVLLPEHQVRMEYGKDRFRAYLAHEDFPFAGRERPMVDSELVAISQEKSLHDLRKWHAKEEEMKAIKMKNLFIGIAIIVGVIILGKVLLPNVSFNPLNWFKKSPATPVDTSNISSVVGAPVAIGMVFLSFKKDLKSLMQW